MSSRDFIHFSCDQAALRTLLSVRPSARLSVCPSVCLSVTHFSLCYSHRIIVKFSGVITIDNSNVHAKYQGQRSKVKVTEVMIPYSRSRTVTQVWIHIWQWNDAQSLVLLRRGALLFFKVIGQISRSHGTKNGRFFTQIGRFRTVTWVFTDGCEMMHNAWSSIEGVPYWFSRSSIKFQGHMGSKIADFDLK